VGSAGRVAMATWIGGVVPAATSRQLRRPTRRGSDAGDDLVTLGGVFRVGDRAAFVHGLELPEAVRNRCGGRPRHRRRRWHTAVVVPGLNRAARPSSEVEQPEAQQQHNQADSSEARSTSSHRARRTRSAGQSASGATGRTQRRPPRARSLLPRCCSLARSFVFVRTRLLRCCAKLTWRAGLPIPTSEKVQPLEPGASQCAAVATDAKRQSDSMNRLAVARSTLASPR
jgi:hypothetical protein